MNNILGDISKHLLKSGFKGLPPVLHIQATSYIVDVEDIVEQSDNSSAPASAPAEAFATSAQTSASPSATKAPKTKEFIKTTHSRKTTPEAKNKDTPKVKPDNNHNAAADAEDISSAGVSN